MKLSYYMKQYREWIAAVVGMVAITNLILLSSIPLKQGRDDILYLNLILLVIFTGAFFSHYRRLSRAYIRINRFIDDKKETDQLTDEPFALPSSDIPGSDIMRRISEMNSQSLAETKERCRLRLEELNNYLTQTVHDLKINLSVCEMAAGRLENKSEIQSKLIYQIGQMKFRIDQILSISRASCFEQDISAEPLDIGASVKDAVRENSEFFIAKNISIAMDLSSFSYIGDRKWIGYIISQILNNSSKYTPDNGELRISGYEDQSAYRLIIRDNGIGIPSEETSRIFDKGFTGANGRTGIRSTGMGLFYAKKMADILGIGLTVDSERRMYTEFTVSFYKLSDYLHLQT